MIFYALMDLSHWWPITLSTTGTVAFLIAKVTYSIIPHFFLFMSALKSCFPLMKTRKYLSLSRAKLHRCINKSGVT
jgi:hypothetical protein